MNLSTTTKYAINILIFMAQNISTKYSSKILSEKLDIPYKYLTKVMTKLTASGIIDSSKGKYGGFTISKNLSDIKMIDIIIVFDDVTNKKCVLADVPCNFEDKCILHDKWQKPRCDVDDKFAQTTLEQIIKDTNNLD